MSPPNTIFLTGFPGFIAAKLIKRLAKDGARFLLLVQPELLSRANDDIKQIAAETNTPVADFQILPGDITKPGLGLSPADLETAGRETTAIYHLAAIYDLAVSREVGFRVNVDGTRNVNRFARERLKNLRRYHYVSTCYVAGLRKGLIRETELSHDKGFRNFYEESKYLAETEVEALKSELPVTIYRPSVVCGDSQTGETAKYDGVYYLIHYVRKHPGLLSLVNIGNSNVRLNLVPVDFVVDAMATLANDDRAIGATVQIADPSPLTSAELFDAIAESISGKKSRFHIPASLVYRSLMLPFSPRMTGLPSSAVPYFFLDQTYDTTVAEALLEPHGVRCPRFQDYVDKLVAFVDEHPKL
jgi:nucleoside-diphosphate-sugar epimerase